MTLLANGFPATPSASNRNNSHLDGQFGLLCSMLVQNTPFFFFNEQVLFTILRYDCNHFHAVKIISYHLDTFHTTAGGLQDFSFTPEYVKNGHHYFARMSSENEIYSFKKLRNGFTRGFT